MTPSLQVLLTLLLIWFPLGLEAVPGRYLIQTKDSGVQGEDNIGHNGLSQNEDMDSQDYLICGNKNWECNCGCGCGRCESKCSNTCPSRPTMTTMTASINSV